MMKKILDRPSTTNGQPDWLAYGLEEMMVIHKLDLLRTLIVDTKKITIVVKKTY